MSAAQVIVTQSSKIRKLIQLAEKMAASSAPVLLTGESGTGKELFAQLIHDRSQRTGKPFVSVNCAALSGTLIESELFGHEKGSFTDAVANRQGRFELAATGSLMLDEISEIPMSSQAKLLRVLENGQYERVGSSHSVKSDVRIIAASNRSLMDEVTAERFRLDLYHRLNVLQIQIPPLRQRTEDIPVLAMHFVRRFKHENSVALKGFSHEAMQAMSEYQWPGNVRELRNVIHRACVLSDTELIQSEHLQLPEMAIESAAAALPEQWLHTELAELERQIITAAIEKFGNQRVVAEKLGVSPRTLSNKLRIYREDDDGTPGTSKESRAA
ncbi:MAG: sigma-54-dependent Fis family transcriptional regulator [Pirellulaceae bacterium]|nr:sigma-54-dependent Fis family transcriptional regulator [Pirellulaceae bacterium]